MESTAGPEEKKESIADKIAKWKKEFEDKEVGLEGVLSRLDSVTDAALAYPFSSLAEAFVFADKSGLSYGEILLTQMNRYLGTSGDEAVEDKKRKEIMDPAPLITALKMTANQARAKGDYKKADETGLEIIRILEEKIAWCDALLLHYSNL